MPKHIFLFPFHQKEEIVKLMIFEKLSQNVWPLGKMEVMLNIILLSFFYHKSRLVLIELTTSFLVGEGARETLGAKLGKNFKTHLAPETLPLAFSETIFQLLKEGCPIHTNGVWSSNYYRSWPIVLDARVWFLEKRVVSTVGHCKLSSFLCHVASLIRWWQPVKGNVHLTISLSQVNKWPSSCPVFSSLIFFCS